VCLLRGAGAAGGNGSRQGLFRYLTVDETAGHLAIMDLLSATLLTGLSAVGVTTQLAERA
jgi:hypothetical protein